MGTVVAQKTDISKSEHMGKLLEQIENEKNILKGKNDLSVDQADKGLKQTLKEIKKLKGMVGSKENANISKNENRGKPREQTENEKNILKGKNNLSVDQADKGLKQTITEAKKLKRAVDNKENIWAANIKKRVYVQSNKNAIAAIMSGRISAAAMANKIAQGKVSPYVIRELNNTKPTGKMKSADISLAVLMMAVMLLLIDLQKKSVSASLRSQLVQSKAQIRLVAQTAKNMIAAAKKRRNAAFVNAAAGAIETFATGAMQAGVGGAGLAAGAALAVLAAIGKAGAGVWEYEAALDSATAEVQRSSASTISQEEGNEQQKFSALLSRLVDDLGALVQQYSAVINALNG